MVLKVVTGKILETLELIAVPTVPVPFWNRRGLRPGQSFSPFRVLASVSAPRYARLGLGCQRPKIIR